jgi:hypothetical protein
LDWIHLAHDRDKLVGSCNQGNECSYSIKCWAFLVWLSNFLLKVDSALWSNDTGSCADYVELHHRITGGNIKNAGESGPTVV